MTRVLVFARPEQADSAARIVAFSLGVAVQGFAGPARNAIAFRQPLGYDVPDVRRVLDDFPYLEVSADLVTP